METFLLSFRVLLEDYSLDESGRHHGPLFHRWLPDGRKHAVALPTGHPDHRLSVWFERRGFVKDGWIEYKHKCREVDPAVMNRQGVLDAGPLMGILEVEGLVEHQLEPIRDDRRGDPTYIELGKRFVNHFIYPQVARFLSILRLNYGQYWIRELPKWDSRRESFGAYCSHLSLRWRSDNSETWSPFIPDDPVVHLTLPAMVRASAYLEYLTEEDWKALEKTISSDYPPSFAASLLNRARRLLDQGEMRFAIIEGCTALEVAMSEFVRRDIGSNEVLDRNTRAFFRLPTHQQMTILAAAVGTVSHEDMGRAIKAIKTRNDLVHNGIDPPDDAKEKLRGLLNTVKAFLSGPTFRFPSANAGNALRPPEKWEQGYGEM